MNNRMNISRIAATLFCVLPHLTLQAQQVNRFPYNLDFTTGSKPASVEYAPGKNSALFTDSGLRITNTNGQFGAVILDGASFNSTNGLEIEFDYFMYGGNTYDNEYGDGLCMFLHDENAPLNVGAGGAALGYSYTRAVLNSNRVPGLNGAYLAVGLDQFGNFKGRRQELNSRMNGINESWGVYASHITLRGAMHPTGISGTSLGLRGLQYSGYPVLISRTTRQVQSGVAGRELNVTDGSYRTISALSVSDTFSIRSGIPDFIPGSTGYRKAVISLVPHSSGGFRVTVEIIHGNKKTTVIDNFHYPTTLRYVENANSNGLTSSGTEATASGRNDTIQLQSTVPPGFKIGFSAGTGAASQVNLIRHVSIRLPYMPRTGADEASLCVNYVSQRVLTPFENDVVYNGQLTGSPQGGNTSSFIDFSSFRFERADGTAISALPYTYTQTGVGTWTYNTATGTVTFAPAQGYQGVAEVYYSIKGSGAGGGPFGQEIYRSGATRMAVTVYRACNTITNPSVPSGQGIRKR